ncbi:DUF4123 domain-containing protein [Rhodovulum sulfidophilum]|uniref:DUF4123 domain-containing protein n=1 Tax=Rhodovulum sulfidophilum TaxID=35806 RepID=UPI0019216BF8|nr:DUF4123 domain-containing protein [Rhodovulum sulfidophilum]MBL3576194.1 DUF4123 domain-containing protein [Rhodovulum sulfidophilum]MCE8433540.1 DUF4123 domain-containing protein [Rhodovulum sulfidophilum]MCF4119144.1 DUF4123 domain-containing protein [Rhodovulum sulfidophilum]
MTYFGSLDADLRIEEIEGVMPLDHQHDVWPLKTVPDLLFDHVFGQPLASEPDATYLKTYAVLDAAKVFGLREILEAGGLNFRCLFKGEAEEDYEDAAPYLVELKDQDAFARLLFTYLPELPEDLTSRHMWHKAPGIYLRSRSSFNDVWTHFRKFIRIQDRNGKWYYFRFWEGRMLGRLLASEKPDDAFIKGFVSHARIDIYSYIYQIEGGKVFVAHKTRRMPPGTSVTRIRYESISSALQEPSWDNFIRRLTEEFHKEFKQVAVTRDDAWLADMCNFARRDGFKIELAIYNYVRSAHLAEARNISFYKILNSLRGKYPTYSDLEISNLLWAAVQPVGHK